MSRVDRTGNAIATGDILENWQGRRAVASYVGKGKTRTLSAKDADGELKTPFAVVGHVKKSPVPISKGSKPSWYRG